MNQSEIKVFQPNEHKIILSSAEYYDAQCFGFNIMAEQRMKGLSEYRRVSLSKMQADHFLSKVGEIGAKRIIEDLYNIPLSEIDYDIRDLDTAIKKGHDVDLQSLDGKLNLHVKTCRANQSFPESYCFSVRDEAYQSPKGNDWCALMRVKSYGADLTSVELRALIKLKAIKRASLFQEPALNRQSGLTKFIYYSSLGADVG